MTHRDFHRPTGRSVWTGKEMSRSDEWVYRFPSDVLAEIGESVARLRSRGGTIESTGKQDFPLVSMTGDLKAIKDELATGRGFICLRGVPREKYTDNELGMIFWGIGSHLGLGMPQSYLGDRLGHIMDVSDEYPDPRQRRAYRSGGAQKMHTDSCDILAMVSLQAAKSGGESRLAPAHTVHNIMLDECPELLEVLYRGFYLRRTDSDAAAAGRPPLSPHRVPVYSYEDGWLNSYIIGGYIRRAVTAGDITLSPEEEAALSVFAALSNHPDLYLNMNLQPGDMQFLSNRSVLHGRADFEDYPEKDRRRHLLRLWLTAPDWPAMSPMQSAHYDKDREKWGEKAKPETALATAS